MNNRYERHSDLQNDYEQDTKQAQQWDQTGGQPGDTAVDYERTEIRGTGHYGGADYGRRERAPEMRQQRRNRYYDDRADEGRRIHTRSERYSRDPDVGYGRFTSESYGGRDYVDPARSQYGVTPYGFGYGGMGYRPDYDDDRDPRRPFLERAGDEIASWFGDDDAARRREMDHRGAGPQNYTRSDERILDDVCDRLTEDRYVDARDVTVTVQEREVTLDGTVSSKAAKRRAEDCTDLVSGVTHVQNNLRVSNRYETDMRQAQGIALDAV
ncbi:BON domain-containing protein [Croceicoccus bisphenolivorans]|uniref:BON domain-containing protein n=1 Tax=Croceicoccus bisphenolivorans TaxID=1783232 RepID=UPI00082CAF0A|nr:BON domain-containing protein [Croceicoccus bisphenolivorans]